MADENEGAGTEQEPGAGTDGDRQPDGQGDGLGDGGREAIRRERAARREAEKARRAAEEELAAIRAQAQQSQEEQAAKAEADRVRREAEAAALAKANERILAAEIRAAAAGKLADPADALRFLSLDDFDVADDGSVDQGAIADAISALVTSKKYLAATAQGFHGSDSDGPAARGTGPAQLTDADLKNMSAGEIVKARSEGRLANLLGGG